MRRSSWSVTRAIEVREQSKADTGIGNTCSEKGKIPIRPRGASVVLSRSPRHSRWPKLRASERLAEWHRTTVSQLPHKLPQVPDRLWYDVSSRVRGRPRVGAGSEPVGDHAWNDTDRSSRFNSTLGEPRARHQSPVKKQRTHSNGYGSLPVIWPILREGGCGRRLTARFTRSIHAKHPIRVIQPCLPHGASSETASPMQCLNRPRSSNGTISHTRPANTESVTFKPPNNQR